MIKICNVERPEGHLLLWD